jgi:hypothetical protein
LPGETYHLVLQVHVEILLGLEALVDLLDGLVVLGLGEAVFLVGVIHSNI